MIKIFKKIKDTKEPEIIDFISDAINNIGFEIINKGQDFSKDIHLRIQSKDNNKIDENLAQTRENLQEIITKISNKYNVVCSFKLDLKSTGYIDGSIEIKGKIEDSAVEYFGTEKLRQLAKTNEAELLKSNGKKEYNDEYYIIINNKKERLNATSDRDAIKQFRELFCKKKLTTDSKDDEEYKFEFEAFYEKDRPEGVEDSTIEEARKIANEYGFGFVIEDEVKDGPNEGAYNCAFVGDKDVLLYVLPQISELSAEEVAETIFVVDSLENNIKIINAVKNIITLLKDAQDGVKSVKEMVDELNPDTNKEVGLYRGNDYKVFDNSVISLNNLINDYTLYVEKLKDAHVNKEDKLESFPSIARRRLYEAVDNNAELALLIDELNDIYNDIKNEDNEYKDYLGRYNKIKEELIEINNQINEKKKEAE